MFQLIIFKHYKYSVINRNDISYIELGKYWAESEAVYNIYKSGIYKEYDYIGFIHYDFDLDHNDEKNITAFINSIIQKEQFISFATYYKQHIMMDENFPNQLVGSGKNCYVNTLKQYNDFLKQILNLKI